MINFVLKLFQMLTFKNSLIPNPYMENLQQFNQCLSSDVLITCYN